MSTFTTTSKSSTPAYSNLSESSATFTNIIKAGQGWLYDQASITYDALTDPANGNAVLYDSEGVAPNWTNQNKS